MQSGREDTLEEQYGIKFCFQLGKMPQKRMECFRLLLDHLLGLDEKNDPISMSKRREEMKPLQELKPL